MEMMMHPNDSNVLVDEGLLTAFDSSDIPGKPNTRTLLESTTTTVQSLIAAIFALPTRTTPDGALAQLPHPTTTLPRERRIPKAKPMTKWEAFAKAKNIKNTKKSRLVRDEATGEELPRFGYKAKQNDKMTDWLIEIPDNAPNDHSDPRLVKREEKKARVVKNAKRQVANIDRANPSVAVGDARKRVLESSLKISKTSTASLGRFDNALKSDAKLKRGEKRKVWLRVV